MLPPTPTAAPELSIQTALLLKGRFHASALTTPACSRLPHTSSASLSSPPLVSPVSFCRWQRHLSSLLSAHLAFWGVTSRKGQKPYSITKECPPFPTTKSLCPLTFCPPPSCKDNCNSLLDVLPKHPPTPSFHSSYYSQVLL